MSAPISRTRRRPLVGDVVILAFRVRPAMREREAGPVAREDLVHREAIDDDDAAVAAEHLAAFVRRFARQDAIERDGRRVHAPHGAGRRRRRPDRGHRVSSTLITGAASARAPERLVGRLEVTRERVDLIPQRLRVDAQPLARHHADLAFERQVIGVLRDGDADGKRRGIATARDELHRAGRGDDRAVARAAVLLAHVLLDLIRELDRGDALRRLVLARHLGQLAAARGTRR